MAEEDQDQEMPEGIDTEPARPIKRKTLSITIKDRPILYAAYMPFLKNGGLFIPTKKYFAMGEELSLIINLLDEDPKFSVKCKIVWITPADAQNNKAGGIGIEFADDLDGDALRRRIEGLLGPMLQSSDATHTM